MLEVIPKSRSAERPRLQVVESTRKNRANQSTAMNQYIKQSIHRVVFESELDVPTLRHVARMFAMPEAKILDVLRETVRELKCRPLPPSGGARRAA